MNSWTIGRRLVVAFVAVQAVVLAVGVTVAITLSGIDAAAGALHRDVGRAEPDAAAVRDAVKDVTVAVWQHAAETDAAQKAVVEQEVRRALQFADDTAQAFAAGRSDDAHRARLDDLTQALGEYRRTVLERALPAHRRVNTAGAAPAAEAPATVVVTDGPGAGTPPAADGTETVLPAVDTATSAQPATSAGPTADELAAVHGALRQASQQLTNVVAALLEEGAGRTQERSAAIVDKTGAALTVVLTGLLLSVGVSAGLAFWLVRGTNRTLRHSVQALGDSAAQVASASGQVSTSAQSLSRGATQQAASLEETSASMEEMAAMTRRNATHSQQAAALMTEVEGRVQASDTTLRAMVAAMSRIEESSAKVSRIIRTIDEIAFQTNILALNAAVEAARAGDAGMGFAVVAEEVRSLAQRSAQAAKDTEALIEESVQMSRDGSSRVEQVASAIAGITDSVKQVKGLVDEVSVASRQQSQGIDQVSQAITQMERVTQSNAATAEESAAASEQLNAEASSTLAVVARLRALVGSDADRTAGLTRPATAGFAIAPRSVPPVLPPSTKVVAMPSPHRSQPTSAQDAEAFLPLGDTGTFGKF